MAQTSAVLLSCLGVLLVMITVQSSVICPAGKEYTKCGSCCPQTCDNLNNTCKEKCEPGCFCKNGTVDNGNGACVKKEDCCTGNTTYSDCGNDCGRVCPSFANPRIQCTKQCFKGCFCNPDYVHLSGSKRCVLREDCPKIAGPHKN